MCMKCNQSISRGTLVKWLSYKTYMNRISPYWADIHVNHEKTLIPVVQRYLDWCDYIVYKKRFARWGSQMVQRGFVSKPELDNLDLDHFSSEELAQKMSGAEYYGCTKTNCSGLVIFSKCGGCKSTYCSKCHEIINEQSDHQCDPTILQSMREVLESTKPCPACRTLITKDGGCNDMRCSNCGVRFSWDKGKIVKKNSNPLGDENVFGKSKSTDKDSYLPSAVAGTNDESLDYILYKRDASAVVKYATEIYNEAKLTSKMNIDALKLRIKFIKGEIDEERWGKTLVNIVDVRDCGKLIEEVLLKHAVSLAEPDSTETWEEKVSRTTSQLEYISVTYNCKVPILKKERTNAPPVI